MLGIGVANMIYVIPSQTMFQERTPADLIGRVVGFRFSLVFGVDDLAMGVGGFLVEPFGVAPVIDAFGIVTVIAGLAGLLVPARPRTPDGALRYTPGGRPARPPRRQE